MPNTLFWRICPLAKRGQASALSLDEHEIRGSDGYWNPNPAKPAGRLSARRGAFIKIGKMKNETRNRLWNNI
jgi:hypothetical protein